MNHFHLKAALAVMALAACLVFAQMFPIPEHEGPDHKGQPEWCQNKDTKTHAANCACENAKMCDDAHGDSKCKTYCRKSACRCAPNCMPTGMRHQHKMEVAP